MPRICINHDRSLQIHETNGLRVRRSLKDGCSLQQLDDGLYAKQESGSGTAGYPDNYRSANGIKSGIAMPHKDTDPSNPYSKRIVSPLITHRVFTCEANDGNDIHVRSCDYVLPGDMYRVLDTTNNVYNYYVILKTNGTTVTAHSGVVATIPADESCN